MPFEVLRLDEAAERAALSERSLRRQIKQGVGPAVTRLGGAVRVRSDMLESWLIERTTPRQDRAAA